MTNGGNAIGGIFGGLIAMGVALWGAEKIEESLNPKEKRKFKLDTPSDELA